MCKDVSVARLHICSRQSECGYLYDGGDHHGEDDGTLERVEGLGCPGDGAHAAEEEEHGCAHCLGEEHLNSLPGQSPPVPATRHLCETHIYINRSLEVSHQ